MNISVNNLIEKFELKLNNKFKSDSNLILGGLTTITKIDESDLQALSNKRKNYNYSQGIEINRKNNEEFKSNYINNNLNVLMNSNNLTENDKRSGYQIKEIEDILFDSNRNKVIVKVKWNEINNINGIEKETEEDYNNIKNLYPNLLINYFEKKVVISNKKFMNEIEERNIIFKKIIFKK